jgi:hypothetical protein
MKILDKAIISSDLEWLGEDNEKDILRISKEHQVSLHVAKQSIILSHSIMQLRSRAMTRKNMENSGKFPKSLEKLFIENGGILNSQKEVDIAENKLMELLNKDEQISSQEFSFRYIDKLEKKRGENSQFDSLLNFLQKNKNYGVVSTLSELTDSNNDEYAQLLNEFQNEDIDIEFAEKINI